MIKKYLWDDQEGMFFDYDFVNKTHRKYFSATAFYPLWAMHSNDFSTALISQKDAQILVNNALSHLEMPGGIAASDLYSRGKLTSTRPARQWDFPNGWPPNQMIACQGLINYGFNNISQRLIYRWLYTIAINAVEHYGAITEKLDVVKRTNEVFAEYGNVGLDFDCIPSEGFGWMNASFQVGLSLISGQYRTNLENLIPPEWVFHKKK